MRFTNEFQKISEDFRKLSESLKDVGNLTISESNIPKTVHIAVDMVNGFVKQGALSSKEVLSINDAVAEFSAKCEKAGITNYALCDCHFEGCTEFDTYPVHCLKGDIESELTDELKNAAKFKVFPKLSVNGWLEDDFRDEIINSVFDTFIISGDCTDMCVLQLALTLKSAMNRINRKSRIIIPLDLVATCSLPSRLPETGELAAILIMQTNGIEIVRNVDFGNIDK